MQTNLSITVSPVNYPNYLRITATKEAAQNSKPEHEQWVKASDAKRMNEKDLSSDKVLNISIPDLDSERYCIRFYDADTYGSIGILSHEMMIIAG